MGEKGSACSVCLQQVGGTFVLPQRHFGCSRPSSAACIRFWCTLKRSMYSFLVNYKAQHVFISGQREAASFWV